MANLSGYIDFSAVFDKSGPTPVIRFIDPNHYPPGVAPTLTGVFKVTQPDGLQVTSPTLTWNGSAFTQPTVELRLNAANTFQNGTYTVLYTVNATGYDQTQLTQTVILSYTPPLLVPNKNFDVFTPILSVTDASNYLQDNLTFASCVRTWQALINKVNTTAETISGSGITFDLNYNGSYYDSQYDISLIANPQYTLEWVTIIDELIKNVTYYAEIPPTLFELLTQLTELKSEVDGTGSICGCKCDQKLLNEYVVALSIYTHLKDRGQVDEVSGLAQYVVQLQKIFNNCKTPTYTNTNQVIPAYDWAQGGNSVTWASITGKPSTDVIYGKVGTVGPFNATDTTFTDSRLGGIPTSRIQFFRNGYLQYPVDPLDSSTYYTKSTDATTTISFSQALGVGEILNITILPL